MQSRDNPSFIKH